MNLSALRILVAAAGLGAAGSAAAIDYALPTSPVRACPRHGQGFVQVPGTTTCLRIGGRVTGEYGTGTRRIDRDRIAGFGTSAAVSMDARTDTEYGPLRSYVRVKAGQGPAPRF